MIISFFFPLPTFLLSTHSFLLTPMPVPARKKSNPSGRRRRSHDGLSKKVVPNCPQCSAPVKPHNACLSCGFYGGKQVLNVGKTPAKIVKKAATKKAPKKKA